MPAHKPAFDLNALLPAAPNPGFDWTEQNRSTVSGSVRTHFGDVASALEQFLRDSDAVVGCVAWITSVRLVGALHGKPVCFIVNKEWALRPTDHSAKAVKLRATLAGLSGGLNTQDFPQPLQAVGPWLLEPVRCVGHLSPGRNTPLMHHKFVVRLDAGGRPTAVWTGSLNMTRNGETSIENAVEIADPQVAAAYLAEWSRVAAVSEPMTFAAGKAQPSFAAPRHAPGKAVTKRKPATARKPAARKTAAPKRRTGTTTAKTGRAKRRRK